MHIYYMMHIYLHKVCNTIQHLVSESAKCSTCLSYNVLYSDIKLKWAWPN